MSTHVVPVRPTEPVFAGHYPGFPVFPGVCVIECVHRTALAATSGHLEQIEQARFLGPIFPGDELNIELSWSTVGSASRCSAEVSTSSALVAQVRMRYQTTRSLPEAAEPSPSGGHALDLDGITGLLPHRFPMLLLDRVSGLVPGAMVAAETTLLDNGPRCADTPLEPHMLVLEAWCQAAGVLATWDAPNPSVLSGQVMLIGSMTGIRMAGQLAPGDLIEHRVRLSTTVGDTTIFAGDSVVDGRTVLSVRRLLVTARPAVELTGALGGQAR